MKKFKKRPITLIEILVVILLIGLIGGALAFNMRGSLDEGRKFKTEQAIARITDILRYEAAEGTRTPQDIKEKWKDVVKASPLGSEKLLKDGWNKEFNVQLTADEDFLVQSPTLNPPAK